MTKAATQYIVMRLVESAAESIEDARLNVGDAFCSGNRLAYYSVLNTIKNELIAHDEDPKDYGLGENLEHMFFD